MRIFLTVGLLAGVLLFSGCSESACGTKVSSSSYRSASNYCGTSSYTRAPLYEVTNYETASYYAPSVNEFEVNEVDSGFNAYTPPAKADNVDVTVDVIADTAPVIACNPCAGI